MDFAKGCFVLQTVRLRIKLLRSGRVKVLPMSQTAADLANAVRDLIQFVKDHPAPKLALDEEQRDKLIRLDARVEALRIKSGLPLIAAGKKSQLNDVAFFRGQFATGKSFGYTQLTVYQTSVGRFDDGELRIKHESEWFARMSSLENLAAECASVPDLDSDEREIVELIIEVGHRLTTSELLDEFNRRGSIKAESTTKGKLSSLTKRGVLNNRHDTAQKGYGLPVWN